MAESCQCEAWDHTAYLATTIHNGNCAKDSDKIGDWQTLNPMRKALASERPATDEEAEVAFSMMKQVMLKPEVAKPR